MQVVYVVVAVFCLVIYHTMPWQIGAYLGADFEHTNRYREFQMSPAGDFLDLARLGKQLLAVLAPMHRDIVTK